MTYSFLRCANGVGWVGTVEVVVVNLYPFFDTVTAPGGTSFENGVENIDIGGPAMIRAAAKVGVDLRVDFRVDFGTDFEVEIGLILG